MHASLHKLVQSCTLPNTLLFCGKRGSGKLAAAQELALALMGPKHAKKLEMGIHPDFRILVPEGKVYMHPIESVRQLIDEVVLPPFESAWRLFVIDEAHRMLPTSGNALLKTLEEPTAHTLLILLTDEPQSLLPTIVSRCRRIDFAPPSTSPSMPTTLQQILATDLYRERLELYAKLEEEVGESMEAIDEIFEHLLSWGRDVHWLQSGGASSRLLHPELIYRAPRLLPWPHFLTLLDTCRLSLARSIKLRHILDYFFLSLF